MIYKKHILTNKIIKADKEVVFQNNENEYTTPTQEEIESLEFETLQTDCINAIEAEKKYLLENGTIQQAGVTIAINPSYLPTLLSTWLSAKDRVPTTEIIMQGVTIPFEEFEGIIINISQYASELAYTRPNKTNSDYKLRNIPEIARRLKTAVYSFKTLAELQAYDIDTKINALRDLREELFLNEASASSIHIPEQPDAGTEWNLYHNLK